MLKTFTAATFAVSMLIWAPGASAQEEPPQVVPLVLAADGTYGATFTQSVAGLFVDTFTFTPASFSLGGTFDITLTPGNDATNLFNVLFNDQGFAPDPDGDLTATFSFGAAFGADAPLSLTVFGFAGDPMTLVESVGSYTAEIAVTPAIPEPATYALLLCGLGLIAGFKQFGRKA